MRFIQLGRPNPDFKPDQWALGEDGKYKLRSTGHPLRNWPGYVMISEPEWLKAICAQHKTEFIGFGFTDPHRVRFELWRCRACKVDEHRFSHEPEVVVRPIPSFIQNASPEDLRTLSRELKNTIRLID
jgi:hypothetical protein